MALTGTQMDIRLSQPGLTHGRKQMTDKKSLIVSMANRYGMEADKFQQTVMATCIPNGKCSNEQFAAFLLVANEYGLNPITREIYAFPSKGGIQPIVGIDGWMTIINNHQDFDGMEFEDEFDDGKLSSITCKIYRKKRTHPVSVTEYMAECERPTEPWKKWPARMLRHKAAIQCARYAFGFSGIVDPDEAERITKQTVDITPPAPEAPPAPPEPKPGILSAKVVEATDELGNREEIKRKPGQPRTSTESYAEQGKQAMEDRAAAKGETFDPDDWLDSLATMFAGCTDEDSVSEVWNDYAQPAIEAGDTMPPDREKAEALYEKHLNRVESK